MSVRWFAVQIVGDTMCLPIADERDLDTGRPFGHCDIEREVKRIVLNPFSDNPQAFELKRGECHAEQDWDNDETPQARWWKCDACGRKFVHLRGMNPSYCPNCGRRVVDA